MALVQEERIISQLLVEGGGWGGGGEGVGGRTGIRPVG